MKEKKKIVIKIEAGTQFEKIIQSKCLNFSKEKVYQYAYYPTKADQKLIFRLSEVNSEDINKAKDPHTMEIKYR